jgi:hypothetical protein
VDPDRRTVDLHLAGPHHSLHAEGRVIAKVAQEKRIDADAPEVALDDQLGRKGKTGHAPIFAARGQNRNFGGQQGVN